jgi:hypothetical protein
MGEHFIVSQDLSIAEMPRWQDIDRTRFMWGNEVLHVGSHCATDYPEEIDEKYPSAALPSSLPR